MAGQDRFAAPWTRRRFLKAAATGAVGVLGIGSAYELLAGTVAAAPARSTVKVGSSPAERRQFRSRPDLSPPRITVTHGAAAGAAASTAPGLIFLTPANGQGPNGPLIVDDSGEPVWVAPHSGKNTTNLQVLQYRGAPVLAWWEGKITVGYGRGDYVIMDRSYRELRRVQAGHGYAGDLHEFVITPEGTALFDIFNIRPGQVQTDRGPAAGLLMEGVVQEVDIATGEVLFEWHSADHVGTGESYFAMPRGFGEPADYFHINSIDVDVDGNLLVSSRHCWTVYKVDRRSGAILWRLGGKRSDFTFAPGAHFSWQHHVRHHSGNRLTVFDNGASGPQTITEPRTRGLLLDLDPAAKTATLVRAYVHPGNLVCPSQGTVQLLPHGHVFMGWGSQPYYSEFSAGGERLFDANFPTAGSYRAFRFPWTGLPTEPPAIAVGRRAAGELTVYASWNGATEVATWEVLAGPGADRLTRVATAPRSGFETAIVARAFEAYVAARALDRAGRPLGTSVARAVAG